MNREGKRLYRVFEQMNGGLGMYLLTMAQAVELFGDDMTAGAGLLALTVHRDGCANINTNVWAYAL